MSQGLAETSGSPQTWPASWGDPTIFSNATETLLSFVPFSLSNFWALPSSGDPVGYEGRALPALPWPQPRIRLFHCVALAVRGATGTHRPWQAWLSLAP